MTKKIKTIIIAGLGIVGITSLGLIPINPESLTVNEWQALIQIYDYEIKKVGRMSFKNFTTENSIKQINNKIRLKIPQEKIVIIDGIELTQDKYKTLRDNLLDKTEKMILIKKIIK